MMAVNPSAPASQFKDEAVKQAAWEAGDLKLEARTTIRSPTFSSCSTTIPFSPAGSLDMTDMTFFTSPVSSPMGGRPLCSEAPAPLPSERQVSWPEEGFASGKFFDDDDSDDDILPGKPLWTYSGPSLEELLAMEWLEKCQEDGARRKRKEDKADAVDERFDAIVA